MKNSTAVILILIAIGLFYTFVDPEYQKIKALQAEAGEYSRVLDDVDRLVELRDGLLVEYENIPRAELDRLEKVLPDNIDTVRLALDLDTIAAKYGISIKNIQVLATPEEANEIITEEESVGEVLKPRAEKVTVAFGFVANYNNFKSFLEDIEESLRITDTRSVTFTSTGEGSLYDYQVTVQTYWLK